MHEYSIDVERYKVIFYLAVISIILSSGLTFLINQAIVAIPIVEFSVSLTSMAVFGGLYTLFSNSLWRKWKWLKKVGFVQTPDLTGTWKGHFYSSHYNFEEEMPAEFIIEQTWSHICITGIFNDSKSFSFTTSIKVRDGGGGIKVYYSYRNEKAPERFNEDFSNHDGYGSLILNEVNQTIKGRYFNDPTNNRNHGKIFLKKTS